MLGPRRVRAGAKDPLTYYLSILTPTSTNNLHSNDFKIMRGFKGRTAKYRKSKTIVQFINRNKDNYFNNKRRSKTEKKNKDTNII